MLWVCSVGDQLWLTNATAQAGSCHCACCHLLDPCPFPETTAPARNTEVRQEPAISCDILMSAGGAGRGKKRKAKGKPPGDSEDVVDCTDDPYEFPGDVQPPAKDAGVLAGWGHLHCQF